MDIDANGFHREDYYLAQIACEVRRIVAKNPGEGTIKDFLIKFEKEEKKPVMSPETRTKMSKAFWYALIQKEA